MWPTVNGLLRDRQQLLQTFHDVYFTGNSETGQMRSLWLCQAIRVREGVRQFATPIAYPYPYPYP